MQRWKGLWLIAVSAIHTVFAAAVFKETLANIAARGVFDTVGEDPMTGAVAWFVLFGFALFIAGLAIHHLEQAPAAPPPRSLGVSLLVLIGVGGALMPVSGFWLAVPPALALCFPRRRQAYA